ncbi:TetR/AcrR family transcriptional regulator C-terminal domain-containing protein [Yoonia sp. R2-816]|uniref:TetR/AcrR family transcriptional regulator C-terminal domain-containing protein n=1 Tax=Yoonia sp. R2-816 TaxID=3342638 RepID=UPI00372BA00B
MCQNDQNGKLAGQNSRPDQRILRIKVFLWPGSAPPPARPAADPSGELGAVISQQGRETVGPLIGQVLLQARARGQLHFDSVNDALELYLGLLVGDLQIRRVIGWVPQPTQAQMAQRNAQAVAHLTTLLRD